MKRLFTLLLLSLFITMGTFAQDKKTWDFTKGLSAETVDNLNADATNWKANGTDEDGNTNNWQNAVKPSPSQELTANGQVIKETAGLLFDIGNNKANSIHIAQSKIRLTRANTTITFPKLKNGQKITIVGRSANGTATDRGIEPVQDHIQFVSGERTNDKCIFLGNQVEGSLGTYSFTWEIVTTEPDVVDVQFKLSPNAGIDFTLFMIDEGDAAASANVCYFYNDKSAESDDPILNYLKNRENTKVTAIGAHQKVYIPTETLQEYDVVVVGPFDTDAAHINAIKEAMPWVPMLNLNSKLYAEWGYGEEAPQEMPIGVVTDKKNALFNNVELLDIDGMNVVELSNEPLTGINLGEYFQSDATPIVGGDGITPLAHLHNPNHNSYIYLPGNASPTPTMLQIIDNAINVLLDSKSEITQAPAPNISFEYKDMNTNVTITPSRNLPKTRLFYTTDGTEPTTESTEYTGVINLTSPTTVKTVAIAEGYLLSDVTEQEIDIKSQPKTPEISYEESDGYTTITITCESEDAVIWYNFNETTDTIQSSKYTEPIVINMPATITAFSVAGEAVWSEVAQKRILVKNPRVVIDVAGHFRAAKWDNISNGAGLFAWGKSAVSMYEGEGEEIIVDPETGEETIAHGPEKEYETIDEPGEDPQWTIMSKGQSVLWQSNTPSTSTIGSNEGGYFPATAEDIDELFPVTNYDIQFYKIQADEPANAVIQSKNKYQAPLDIVTIANMQGGPIIAQVSADGENWTTVGEEIAATGYTRMWKKYTNSYDGNDEVYVRLAQMTGSLGAKIPRSCSNNSMRNIPTAFKTLHTHLRRLPQASIISTELA
jgi:hypothetical protein